MPTISTSRDLLFEKIGQSFTDEQFDELCFEYGIELDEVTSEKRQAEKEKGVSAAKASSLSEEVIYKIEIPANRYDMLSVEGIARALRIFLGKARLPAYRLSKPVHRLVVSPEAIPFQPVIVAAVLRNICFTPASYDSFIELQDKIHSGIGRRRQIVSMGTYDLDTVDGPFTYDALDPAEIVFRPLNQQVTVDGHGLMRLYESDLKIRKFLPLIRDLPRYPVIRDANRRVMSLPPIINSEHAKITLATRNVFIDVTATDLTKALLALSTIVTDFAEYCAGDGLTIEPVEIVQADGSTMLTPCLDSRLETVSVEHVNRAIGIQIDGAEMARLLSRMALQASVSSDDASLLCVTVPPTRSDIFHACDIVEDVAIAYGFNRIPRTVPSAFCIAAPFSLNKLTDLLRREVALLGFTEVLTLTLCSKAENYAHLCLPDNGTAVVLSNPKTVEYEVVHTSLFPEMLKTLASNKRMPLPLRLFQISDVVLLDAGTEVGARNERRLCALYANQSASGFEIVHGVLDRTMMMVGVPHRSSASASPDKPCYYVRPSAIPTYFSGRQAEVVLKNGGGEECVIGSFGIVHPKVLANFDIPSVVCSMLEINIEPFL